ncbi:MAG: hypothetical protein Q9M16_07345, partial [Mariprofundus sp.]|nr:hypothetical protein [Mariprofundus sp.]
SRRHTAQQQYPHNHHHLHDSIVGQYIEKVKVFSIKGKSNAFTAKDANLRRGKTKSFLITYKAQLFYGLLQQKWNTIKPRITQMGTNKAIIIGF